MKTKVFTALLSLFLPLVAFAQVTSNNWKLSGGILLPVVSTWQLKIPQLGGTGTRCIHVDNNGLFSVANADCGSGGGGSTGGTWSTTTSSVASHYINYPNNSTDIVVIGGSATTTAPFWYDPNTKQFYVRTSTTTFEGSPISFSSFSQGLAYLGTGSQFNTVSTSSASCSGGASCSAFTVVGSVSPTISVFSWPFTASTNYVSTSTTVGFSNGLFSTASSTFNNNLFLPNLSQGFLYTGTNGLVQTIASSSIKLSWFNNDSGFITSAVTSVGATWPVLSSGGNTPTISWGGLATTSQPSSSNLLVSNGVNGIYGVGTSTLTASSPLTGSFTQVGSGGSLGCQTASGSQAGCLSSADWTTFNNKGSGSVTSVTAGAGFQNQGLNITTSGTLVGAIATATTPTVGQLAYWGFAGDTSNPAKLNTVATGTISAGSSAITVTANRYAIGGALSIDCATASGSQNGCLSSTDWTTFNNKQATIGVTWPITLNGATIGFNGLSTTSAAIIGNIPYFSGVNTFANVATSTLNLGNSLQTTGGSLGYQIGGSNVTIDTIQDIRTSASPSFTGLTISGLTVPQILYAGTGGIIKTVATSTLSASSPLTGSFTQVGSGGSLGCQTASGSQAGCLSSTDWTTFNNKLGSYDAWIHPLLGLSATTSQMLFGTTTGSNYGVIISTSTAPQLSLSTGAGILQWTLANEGGNLYLSTTTVAGTATSTSNPFWISGSGFGTTTLSGLNISASATTTSNVGYSITSGCFADSGGCLTHAGGGSVTSITTTWPIQGGPITTTGTLTFGGLSTSTNAVIGNIPYFSGVNTFANIATSTIGLGNSLQTTAGSLGYQIGGSAVTIDTIQDIRTTASPSFTGLTISGITSGQALYAGTGGKVNGVSTSTISCSGILSACGSGSAVFGSALSLSASYDAFTHPLLGLSATTTEFLIGTSTGSNYQLIISTSTAPQLSLSTGAGLAQWTLANEGANFYVSTTTVAGTSTSTPFFSILNGGNFLIGTTTIGEGNNSTFKIVGTSTFWGNFALNVSSSTAASTQTINWSNGATQVIMLTANTNIVVNSTSSNPIDGGKYTLRICQDPTGSRTLTWANPISLRWWNGTTTISSAANLCTWIGMIYTNRNGHQLYDIVASSTGLNVN